ncbi:MAG: cytochrome c oxidase subunit 3 [SAR324 cluster bacterium]|nr:cytochrome c oxidase subunit 3 [SAR324 cluster bacterium]
MTLHTGTNAIPRRQVVPSGVIAMLLFVATEIMFFASLISAYLVIRAGALEWPPWGQPRLPVAATSFNTVILLLSGAALLKAHKTFFREDNSVLPQKLVGISIALGVFFVAFQGYEWVQLIQFGLTMVSSTYGALFYLIIGTHALHAVLALLVLFYAYWRLSPARKTKPDSAEFLSMQIFWYFVVGVWPFLYVLVYLI